jgi:hypothetical protein
MGSFRLCQSAGLVALPDDLVPFGEKADPQGSSECSAPDWLSREAIVEVARADSTFGRRPEVRSRVMPTVPTSR